MSQDFKANRRQPFLVAEYFHATEKNYYYLTSEIEKEVKENAGNKELISLHHADLADFSYELFSLDFTAGQTLGELRSRLTDVIEAYERYQKALAFHEGVTDIAPLSFVMLDEYERALQLVSLCYLLHRRDLLPRLRALFDPGYAGQDTVYEDLMAFDVAGRADVDEWFHEEPYSTLVNAMYLEQPEANRELNKYCESWYKCFESVAPWHDSHTRIEGTEGDYYGYWAFEAAAVAFLYDLDDSEIDHMVYPKDLVAWARDNKALSEEDAKGHVALRAMAGHSCPRDGYYFTPAKTDSRRHFKQGEKMPSLGGDYGLTIWQWDVAQAAV
jgi:Domain of unknown function (DUF1911)